MQAANLVGWFPMADAGDVPAQKGAKSFWIRPSNLLRSAGSHVENCRLRSEDGSAPNTFACTTGGWKRPGLQAANIGRSILPLAGGEGRQRRAAQAGPITSHQVVTLTSFLLGRQKPSRHLTPAGVDGCLQSEPQIGTIYERILPLRQPCASAILNRTGNQSCSSAMDGLSYCLL
jgi:hypothetical protein